MSREAFEAWFAKYHESSCAEYGGLDCTNPKGIADDAWQAALDWAYEDAARVCDERAGNGNNGKWWALKATADELRERAKEVTR